VTLNEFLRKDLERGEDTRWPQRRVSTCPAGYPSSWPRRALICFGSCCPRSSRRWWARTRTRSAARLTASAARSGRTPATSIGVVSGRPGRHDRVGDLEDAHRVLLPGLAVGARGRRRVIHL